jgi:putative FmdB family regulatory protein
MPLYVYRCNECDYSFEARQRMSDAPLAECPSCHAPQLRRIVSNVGVVFKGSGFYITDSRKGSSSNGSSASSSSPSKKGESKKETQSDSGPAS